MYVFASGFVYVVCLGTANCEFPESLPATVKRCNETDAQLSFPSPSQHFTGQLLQSGTKLRNAGSTLKRKPAHSFHIARIMIGRTE